MPKLNPPWMCPLPRRDCLPAARRALILALTLAAALAMTLAMTLASTLATAGTPPMAGGEDPYPGFPSQSGEEPLLADIVVTGNHRTDTDLILRELGLRIGEPFSLDRMDQAWDALEDCGYFRTVKMEYDDDEPGEVVLRVAVEEDLATYFGPVIRYDRRHKYLLGGWLEERNFRGRGERLRLEAIAIYVQKARLSWGRPWFLGRSGLSAEFACAAEQGDFVFRPTRYRKWQVGGDLRWEFRRPFFVGAGASLGEFERRDSFSWPAPYRGPDAPADPTDFPAGSEGLRRLVGTAGLDSRNNPYYPQRGVLLQAQAVRWSSGDFPAYWESTLDGRFFLPLPWHKHVVALRAWGRRTDRPAHLDNLLHWGGPETVRGYAYASREGDEGYLLTAEYRLPLFLMPISPQGELVGFGLHAFADAGDVWFEGADPGRAQQSWGAGVHLNLDTLQFRFEGVRTAEGEWAFEFFDRFNF